MTDAPLIVLLALAALVVLGAPLAAVLCAAVSRRTTPRPVAHPRAYLAVAMLLFARRAQVS